MELKLGFLNAEHNLQIHTLDTLTRDHSNEKMDLNQINSCELNLLVYNQELQDKRITEQSKYLPITTFDQLERIGTQTAPQDYQGLVDLYHTVSDRWVIKNNLSSIENLVPLTQYLKELWTNNRYSFFEELWYLLKTNTKCSELTLVFHDLKQPATEEQDKEIKPELTYSSIKGKKLPNLQPGSDIEVALMENYAQDFNAAFNLTEYSDEKMQLVACARIDLSPVLIMARLTQLTALQQALINGLFKGLQKTSDQTP
jgi:hypothetical protein